MGDNVKKQSSLKERLSERYSKFVWLRDIVIGILIVSSIMVWQKKDMLDTDGSVQLDQQNLVTLEGSVAPLLVEDRHNLVYFFAPWCTICDLSIDNLEYIDSEKVNVVVVALDFETKEEVEKFIKKNEVTAQVFLGTNEMKKAFNIKGYPSYYLVDNNNSVISSSFGYSTALGLKLREFFGREST